jgi:ferredoxin
MAERRPTAFRVVVDAARCDGYGICVLRCPELLSLDEWGYAGAADNDESDAKVFRRARRAAAACPEGAISIRALR